MFVVILRLNWELFLSLYFGFFVSAESIHTVESTLCVHSCILHSDFHTYTVGFAFARPTVSLYGFCHLIWPVWRRYKTSRLVFTQERGAVLPGTGFLGLMCARDRAGAEPKECFCKEVIMLVLKWLFLKKKSSLPLRSLIVHSVPQCISAPSDLWDHT